MNKLEILTAFVEMVQKDLDENNIAPAAAVEVWNLGIKEYILFKNFLTPEQIALKEITVQNENFISEEKPEKRR